MIGILYLLQALVGVIMMLGPTISRRTVPLGVDVPLARIHDSVVRRSLRRYRCGVAAATILLIAVSIAFRRWPLVQILSIPWMLIVCMGMFAWCRRPIITRKHAEHWYEGHATGIGVDIADPVNRRRPTWWLHVVAVTTMVTSMVGLAVSYDTLPAHYPTHWNANGHVDAIQTKSWITVLLPSITGLVLTILVGVVSWGISRQRVSYPMEGDSKYAKALSQWRDRSIQRQLGTLNIFLSMLMAFLAFLPVTIGHISQALIAVVVILLIVLLIAVPMFMAVLGRPAAPRREEHGQRGDPESPDADQWWKFGIFSVNRNNPSMFVPKRSGMGVTFNFGNPKSIMIFIGLLLVSITMIAVAIMTS